MICFRDRRKSGFTLVEVMIALMVFTVLTLIFATSIPLAQKAAKMSGRYSQAISLCQHKIDQIRAVGYGRINYTELSDAGIIDGSPLTAPFQFKVVDEVETYLPQPEATLVVEAIATDQIRVTATVTWRTVPSATGTSSASLSGIISNVE